MVLTIHHLGHSQSDRIVWLCEELGIPYTLEKYSRAPLFSPPEFLALHDLGAAPVIDDSGANPPVRLAETEACIAYITNVHGGGRLTIAPTAPNYADYLYWYHLANGTLQPVLGRIMTLRAAGVAADDPVFARFEKRTHTIIGMYDRRLATTGAWLAGEEFTLADVISVFSFTGMREFIPVNLGAYPNVLAWLARCAARPAHKRAVEKGDPDIEFDKFIQAEPPAIFPPLRR